MDWLGAVSVCLLPVLFSGLFWMCEHVGWEIVIFFFLFATLRGMCNLSSLTRDRTYIPCIGSAVLSTGPSGKSQEMVISYTWLDCKAVLLPQMSVCLFEEAMGLAWPILPLPPTCCETPGQRLPSVCLFPHV